MRKSIIINIPKPCHEDWNKMTSKEKGRHCSVCSKTVLDFTKQSDEQIFKTFKTSKNLCGRFKNQQLDREIVFARKERNYFRNLVASGLFAFLAIGNQKSDAQTVPIKTVQNDTLKTPYVKGKIAHSILNNKLISGFVKAKSDGLFLPGVNVIVKGTARGTQTDFDGKFNLKVKNGETLVFTFIGMKTEEILVTNEVKYTINMLDDSSILGDIEIVAGYTSVRSDNYYKRKERKEERKAIRKANKLKRLQIRKSRNKN